MPIYFIILFVGFFLFAGVMLFSVFKLCDRLLNVFKDKYPDLYEEYKDRLTGNRRSPFFILLNSDVKNLSDPEIDEIKKQLKIWLVLFCLGSWSGFFVVGHYVMHVF